MVRRTDRPLLQVRVSFEATRTGPQHLIEAYARLVPTVRRTSRRPKRSEALPTKAKIAIAAGSGSDA
jgi:transcriptional regulator of nitric oxide reductase